MIARPKKECYPSVTSHMAIQKPNRQVNDKQRQLRITGLERGNQHYLYGYPLDQQIGRI